MSESVKRAYNKQNVGLPRNHPNYIKEYYKQNKDKVCNVNLQYKTNNKAKVKDINKIANYRRLEELKAIIYTILGGYCKCCGDSMYEMLSIDHINGGGRKEKKEHGHGTTLLLYIIKQGIPKDKYQLLCGSCNQAKSNKKQCPHQNFNVFDKSTWF